MGAPHWVIAGRTNYIRDIFINLIAVSISKKDVLQRVQIMVVTERVK